MNAITVTFSIFALLISGSRLGCKGSDGLIDLSGITESGRSKSSVKQADPRTLAANDGPEIIVDEGLRKQRDERNAHILGLGRKDLNDALAYIASEVPPALRLSAKEQLMEGLCREKLEMMREIPLVLPAYDSKTKVIEDLVRAWITKDPNALEEFAKTLPRGDFSDSVYTELTDQLARQDRLEEAKALVAQIPDQVRRSNLIGSAAIQMSPKKVDHVLDWVASIPDEMKAIGIRMKLADRYATDKNVNALRKVAFAMPTEKRAHALHDLGLIVAQMGFDEVLQELGNPEYNLSDRESIVLGAMTTIPFADLSRLFEIIKASESRQTRQDAAAAYVLRLLDVRPEDAMEWAKIAPADMRKVALQNIVHSWGLLHANEMFAWIETLPEASDRDMALEDYIGLMRAGDPDAAKRAAEKIGNSETRERVLNLLK